jgi:hypothetical protein
VEAANTSSYVNANFCGCERAALPSGWLTMLREEGGGNMTAIQKHVIAIFVDKVIFRKEDTQI